MPGSLDRAVDAEVDVLALAQAPVGLDLPERVEVAHAGVRAARRRRAARHRAADAHEGLAETKQTTVPRVFLVRLAAVEVDEHAEAAPVERLVAAGAAAQLLDRRVGQERDRLHVAAVARRSGRTRRSSLPA